MSVFLETIRCVDGIAQYLDYHQERLERTLKHHGISDIPHLRELLFPPEKGIYRCRFVYGESSHIIEFIPYAVRSVRSLKLIEDDTIDYRYKYADRTALECIYGLREECDDVLIVQHGWLRDTSIANVALYIGGRWLTPDTPLLEGTTRKRLIETGTIFPADLHVNDLKRADKIAVMNAMTGLVEVENGIIA